MATCQANSRLDQQTISWRQFRDSFFSTYFPVQARNKKMQEFLDLQQNHLSLEEYVTKYRHLEAYCPHLYTTAEARADKFIYGLRDGLRGRVMSSSPRNLDRQLLGQDAWKKIGLGLRGIIRRKLLSTLRVGVCQSNTIILQAGQGLMKGVMTERSGGTGQAAVRLLRGQWPLRLHRGAPLVLVRTPGSRAIG
ncbi:hypothetical protein EJ110_NYTH54661 [Nymphaea thermarum]|nr:hypothetical protein EJ110_NYTH54661 [Nymphaea thermarum]